jgi:hypothetical protein
MEGLSIIDGDVKEVWVSMTIFLLVCLLVGYE